MPGSTSACPQFRHGRLSQLLQEHFSLAASPFLQLLLADGSESETLQIPGLIYSITSAAEYSLPALWGFILKNTGLCCAGLGDLHVKPVEHLPL